MHQKEKITLPLPWTFFILAFLITWLIWSPGLLATWGLIELPVPFLVIHMIGSWGPFLAACWVIGREGGRAGLKSFLKRGLDWHISWKWVLIVVLLPLLLGLAPLLLHVLAGGPAPALPIFSQPWMILGVFALYFTTGGANEEWGWRGFALDRLQNRWSALKASIVLGLVWGVWHLPLFFIEYTGQYHMSLVAFVLFAPAMSVLHTWVYNSTGRNLVSAWLLHAMFGTAWEIFPIVQPGLAGYDRLYLWDFAAVFVAATIVVWLAGAERLSHRKPG